MRGIEFDGIVGNRIVNVRNVLSKKRKKRRKKKQELKEQEEKKMKSSTEQRPEEANLFLHLFHVKFFENREVAFS
jgi:hypothetical protein